MDIVAVDLWLETIKTFERDGPPSKAVCSSGTYSNESRSSLSRNDDSNRVCEAIRADTPVKHNPPDFAKEVHKSHFATALARGQLPG